jgi:hypothetical protein
MCLWDIRSGLRRYHQADDREPTMTESNASLDQGDCQVPGKRLGGRGSALLHPRGDTTLHRPD